MVKKIYKEKKIKKEAAEKFFKYLIIGGLSVVIDAGLLFVLTEYIKINYLISGGVSFWLALLFNFQMNRTWIFDAGKDEHIRQFVGYLFLVAFNFVFTLSFMFILTDIFNVHYLFSKLASVGIITLWNFIIYKKLIFRKN